MGYFKDNLLRFLHSLHLRYSGSTTLDLLIHLYVTYAVIRNDDCIENDKWFC